MKHIILFFGKKTVFLREIFGNLRELFGKKNFSRKIREKTFPGDFF